MKRVLLLTLTILTLIGLVSANTRDKEAKAEMTFAQLNYDFGTLPHKGDKVTHLFEFTNTGSAPLIISRTTTSCRCITIKAPKRPVRSGESGNIEVTYDPKDLGAFNKAIDIYANIPGGYITLFVKGVVE